MGAHLRGAGEGRRPQRWSCGGPGAGSRPSQSHCRSGSRGGSGPGQGRSTRGGRDEVTLCYLLRPEAPCGAGKAGRRRQGVWGVWKAYRLVFDGGTGHAEVQLAVLLDAGVNQGLDGGLLLEQQEGVAWQGSRVKERKKTTQGFRELCR